ncbi:MAG: hypothetical protein ACXVAY_17810 [Mucilaginibacter sp.]
MLKNSLFKVVSVIDGDGIITAAVDLDENNAIFSGHFPGRPVLPGACMVQLVKEVLEETLGKSIRLQKADNLKFLSLIDPHQNNHLALTINYIHENESIKVTATLTAAEVVCFKLQGSFVAK